MLATSVAASTVYATTVNAAGRWSTLRQEHRNTGVSSRTAKEDPGRSSSPHPSLYVQAYDTETAICCVVV